MIGFMGVLVVVVVGLVFWFGGILLCGFCWFVVCIIVSCVVGSVGVIDFFWICFRLYCCGCVCCVGKVFWFCW